MSSLKAHLISRNQAAIILGRDPCELPSLRIINSFPGKGAMFIRKEVMAAARKLARERKAKAD